MTTARARQTIGWKHTGLLLSLLVILGFPLGVFADAGKMLFVIGQVDVVTASGETVKASKGMVVNAGDTIRTSSHGQVQVKMDDGGLLAIRPNSEFMIDEFVYNQDVNTDKNFYQLVKGSFRSVTGAIGQAKKSAYKVGTPIGTIGIRGTDYTARLCAADCNADDGLYVEVMSGGVTINNDVSSLDVDASEYGYVQDATSEPVLLDGAPGDLLFASNGTTSTTESTASTVDVNVSLETIATNLVEPVIAVNATTTSGNSYNLATTVEIVPESNDGVTDETQTTDDTVAVTDDPVDDAIVDVIVDPVLYRKVAMVGDVLAPTASKELSNTVTHNTLSELLSFQVSDQSANVSSFSTSDSTLTVDAASSTDGSLSWGRWLAVNTTRTDSSNNSIGAVSDVHWIASNEFETDLILPTSGTANYNIVGGTKPTDNFGNVGTLDLGSSSLTIQFSDMSGTFVARTTGMNDPEGQFGLIDWRLQYAIGAGGVESNGRFSGSLTSVTHSHPTYDTSTPAPVETGTVAGFLAGNTNNAASVPSAALAAYQANLNYDNFDSTGRIDYQINGVAVAELAP